MYETAEVITTYGNAGVDEYLRQTLCLRKGSGTENQVINLYPEVNFESFEGFGGAITESAAYVYAQMNEDQKKNLLDTYFSEQHMNYQHVRIPEDSCDFALEQYEAMGKETDTELKSFSLSRDEKWILPMLQNAQELCGRKLKVMLSPWSPPAFMKTNGERSHGGKLKPEYATLWAEYLCRYVEEYRKRGVNVCRISLQNEPKAAQEWDSCVFTAEEEKAFLRDFMFPAMKRHGLMDVEIFIWDHNKERVYEWLRDIVDEDTDPMITGAAVHWYSGDHFEALDLCRKCFPGKKLIVSESCIEFSKFGPDEALRAAQSLAHEIIGDLNHGISAFYDWNLLLDQHGGPNHVKNYCLAPFLFDDGKKELKKQLLQRYLEHFAHWLTPGSVRVAFSCYTADIECTAWKRPDGSIVLFLLNTGKSPRKAVLRINEREAALVLWPESITTVILHSA